MSNPLVAVVVIVAVVVVVGLFGLLARRRTRPLARHLRSASYGRRRSEVIKRQAAEDVAAIEQDDEYYRRAQHGEPTDDL